MNNTEYSYIKAKNRVDREKRFYTHCFIYFAVNIILTVFKVWGDLDSWDSFINELKTINVWSTWLIWGIFLLLHFFFFKFGQDWEERKIEALMNKELQNKSKN